VVPRRADLRDRAFSNGTPGWRWLRAGEQ
jgi:hypothetical protein